MRILHTSDWHLGHMLKGWPRTDEHAAFLSWLLETLVAEQVDVLLVAGDVFDAANPPASAQETWYTFLASVRRVRPELEVVVIGGNHDSPSRLDAPNPLLRALGVHLRGGVPRAAERVAGLDSLLVPVKTRQGERAVIAAVPFLRIPDLPAVDAGSADALIEGVRVVYRDVIARARAVGQGAPIVAMGHLFMAGTHESDLSERRILGGNQHALPVDIFPREVAYVALGHLHKAQKVAREDRVRYSGSPIPLSFAEASYAHQVALVDLKDGELASVRGLTVPHRVKMLRIPETGSAPLADVLVALRALPAKGLFPDPRSPFLEVSVTVDRPEPTLQQQVYDALNDRGVRLLTLTKIMTGTTKPLAETLHGHALETLSPEQVFVERHRRQFDAPPSADLLGAFHELLGVAHARVP